MLHFIKDRGCDCECTRLKASVFVNVMNDGDIGSRSAVWRAFEIKLTGMRSRQRVPPLRKCEQELVLVRRVPKVYTLQTVYS